MFDRYRSAARDDMRVIRSWFLLNIEKDRPRYARALVMWIIAIFGMAGLANNILFETPDIVSISLYFGLIIIAASLAHLWGGVPAPSRAEIDEYYEQQRIAQQSHEQAIDPAE